MNELVRLVRFPWKMATSEDARLVSTRSGLATRMSQRYLSNVLRQAVHRPPVHRAFLEVLHMVKSPLSLLSPSISLGLLRGRS